MQHIALDNVLHLLFRCSGVMNYLFFLCMERNIHDTSISKKHKQHKQKERNTTRYGDTRNSEKNEKSAHAESNDGKRTRSDQFSEMIGAGR